MLNRKRVWRGRRGFSLIELLIVIAIILIIITMAVPKFTQSRKFANEVSAVRSLQTINSAQVQFQSVYGRYATSLTELGPSSSGAPSPSGAELISGDLSAGEKGGYKFSMAGSEAGYQVHANPDIFKTTGDRTFFTDQNMVIRQNFGQEPASASSAEFK